jgi:uncharacterized SAM-binding protein YcdF (DUF218 family)
VRRFRRLVLAALAAVICVGVAAVTVGFVLFNRPHADGLEKADAVIVLSGDGDDRVAYGLDLAREGYAPTVVLSSVYPSDQADEMQRACSQRIPGVTVICFRPDPPTTRGEATFVADLSRKHQWSKLIVVSWNYHIVRARYIFSQCFDGRLIMRPVPHDYEFGPIDWARVYAYQFGAMVKAVILGCHR